MFRFAQHDPPPDCHAFLRTLAMTIARIYCDSKHNGIKIALRFQKIKNFAPRGGKRHELTAKLAVVRNFSEAGELLRQPTAKARIELLQSKIGDNMKLTINGESKEYDSSLSVSDLLKRENVQMPETVSVQLNEEFVAQEHYASTQLKEGDEVNFLYFMGGGGTCGFF